jgi:hypothetical protein
MSFEKEGFLSQEAEEYKSKVINDNQGLFHLCFELNTLAHGFKYDLQVHNQDAQEMILGCLLIRLLNNFQGIVILTNYGLVIEAKILLRSMLETLFILKICCEDKDFINKYIKSDQVYRYKLLNIPENNPDRIFDALREYATKDIKKQVKENIKVDNIKEFEIYELAEKAGLKSHYDSAYRLLCNTSHSGVRSLEEYLVLDEKREVQILNSGPIEKDFDLVLITAMDNLCLGLHCIFYFFKIDKRSIVDEFRKKIIELKK